MPNEGYVPFGHYLVKAIDDVSFPTTKSELIQIAGDRYVAIKPGSTISLQELFSMLEPEQYKCATALYCAVAATIEKRGL